MSRRLATSLIIAFAAGCGGPLDVGGVADEDEAGAEVHPDAGGVEHDASTTAGIPELNQAIAGDWYLFVEATFPILPQGLLLRLHLEPQVANGGSSKFMCLYPSSCQDMRSPGGDGGAGGSIPYEDLLNFTDYWLVKADGSAKGTGFFANAGGGVTFLVDVRGRSEQTHTIAVFGLEFSRQPPAGFKGDAGAP